jgi:hypothetical protein
LVAGLAQELEWALVQVQVQVRESAQLWVLVLALEQGWALLELARGQAQQQGQQEALLQELALLHL